MTVSIVRTLSPIDQGALSIRYGEETIFFNRTDREQVNDRVLIKVHPSCRVDVAAPLSATEEEIIAAVKKRARWVYRQLRDFREQQAYYQPRQFISGESHYYLGKQYLLKVQLSSGEPDQVKLLRGKLEVITCCKQRAPVRDLLTDWYKHRARDTFEKRLFAMLDQALWVQGIPELRLQSMKTQWGSCSPKGRITLNPHLVKAPRQCIDYVILHELCHIAEHNHSLFSNVFYQQII